eukprot:gnl/Spiro4/1206_TR633_c0_g1_i1.p1 gnl/Spiro4/1206_TR633_c0_g1~~gnl/Spiro4/1206_TR633_c0_g1_i1.p1  ORF type:complete len:370 (-),score=72.18 gnl/Spiro4/1206_TR633_c0_g1_i1:21-1130(-)
MAVVHASAEVLDLQYSTVYQHICAAGTCDFGGWYHGGHLLVLRQRTEAGTADSTFFTSSGSPTSAEPPPHMDALWTSLSVLCEMDNSTGIHALCWSESFISNIACANHNGTFGLWDANSYSLLANCVAHADPVLAIDWNQLLREHLLTASYSPVLKLWDVRSLFDPVLVFSEHTQTVNSVKWNNNKTDEFASVSEDATLRIWDQRTPVAALCMVDTSDGAALRCVDWHKADEWRVVTGSASGRLALWDTRAPLHPIKSRTAHGANVKTARFDTVIPERLVTTSEECVLRVWDTGGTGLLLTHEIAAHEGCITAADWNVHEPRCLTSCGTDGRIVSSLLAEMTQVNEIEKDGVLVTEKLRPSTPTLLPRL